MSPKTSHPGRRRFIGLVAAGLVCTGTAPVLAAGRTYTPQNGDDRPKLELCRLRKRELHPPPSERRQGRRDQGR